MNYVRSKSFSFLLHLILLHFWFNDNLFYHLYVSDLLPHSHLSFYIVNVGKGCTQDESNFRVKERKKINKHWNGKFMKPISVNGDFFVLLFSIVRVVFLSSTMYPIYCLSLFLRLIHIHARKKSERIERKWWRWHVGMSMEVKTILQNDASSIYLFYNQNVNEISC
jgi:hypothetical protein